VEERSRFILDAFLNTPDLIENNTPLHYACKYGTPDVVDLLVSNRVCKKHPRNKYNERPLDMLCRAFKGTQSEKERVTLEINSRIQGRHTPSPGRSIRTPSTPTTSSPKETSKAPSVDTSPISSLANQFRTKLKLNDTPPSPVLPTETEKADERASDEAESSDNEVYVDAQEGPIVEEEISAPRRMCGIL